MNVTGGKIKLVGGTEYNTNFSVSAENDENTYVHSSDSSTTVLLLTR